MIYLFISRCNYVSGKRAYANAKNIDRINRKNTLDEDTRGVGRGRKKAESVWHGDTHLASGPLLFALCPSIFSTTVTFPFLAASSSSWSFPMFHLHRDRPSIFDRALVNFCFYYDYSRFIDPAWPSCRTTKAPSYGQRLKRHRRRRLTNARRTNLKERGCK